MTYEKEICVYCYMEKEVFRAIHKEIVNLRNKLHQERSLGPYNSQNVWNDLKITLEKNAELLEPHKVECVIVGELRLCKEHVQIMLEGFNANTI